MNSQYILFSFYNNALDSIKKQREVDLYKGVNNFWYSKIRPQTKRVLTRVYSEMESGHYKYKDVFAFMLTRALFGETTELNDIKTDSIKANNKVYSIDTLTADCKILEDVSVERGYKSIKELYYIHEDGKNVLYDMVMSKTISPCVYVKYFKNMLTLTKENIIFSDDDMNRFNFIMGLLYKTFKKGAN